MKKLSFFFLMMVAAITMATAQVTATWNFQTMGSGDVAIQSTTGTVASDVEGIVLTVDATSGKLQSRGSDAQFNQGTVIQVPVISTNDVVTVTSYPGYHNYTIGGVAAEADTETHTATALEVNAGHVDVVATGSAYLYLISVVQVEPSAGGNSYDNEAVSFSWLVGNEDNATAHEAAAIDALQTSSVVVGTDLVVGTKSDYAANSGNMMVTYQPSTSNAGCDIADMIEYTVQMKKGITFTIDSIAYDALKDGTDGAHYSWSYTQDGVEGTQIEVDAATVLRNNSANASTANLKHVEAITGTAARSFSLRFYISHTANNKKIAISNVHIYGKVNGAQEVRAFQPFELDFRNVAELPATPAGVISMTGTCRQDDHGLDNFRMVVPVDGPVRLTLGGCQYSSTDAQVIFANRDLNGDGLTHSEYDYFSIDVKTPGCYHNGGVATWVYNYEEPDTLTIVGGQYTPYIKMEPCDLLPMCKVTYYDTDGKTVVGEETVQGGSALLFAYGASDVTVAEGKAFRGWFNSASVSATKVLEGATIQANTKLYAKATDIEVVTPIARFIYELNKTYFYVEDHEAITVTDGQYHDAQHGWDFHNGSTIQLPVAGKALVSLGLCRYADSTMVVVTDANGAVVDQFCNKAADSADGAEYTVRYNGPATTLTFTFGGTSYVHRVTVYNVVDFVSYDEATGYYMIPANDANSFLLALVEANGTGNRKIFLPNGTYDLGELVLTTVSGNNISIIGESMEGTILKNAPAVENEGIGTTATLYNTSDGLYIQDLTIQNALDYYASGSAGRAVCLQDKGKNTICKNVKMLSYQDTYYSNAPQRFYWEDCEIHGTVDYLCGDGDVVYNRVKLVNESRSKDGNTGDCTVCAPYTSASCLWGYVFLDCQIDTKSASFNLGRSWGGESKAQYIRCQDLTNKLVANRWTKAGMNIAAYKFKEYGTMDKDGNVTTPTSNVVKFTHSSGDLEYETVLSADEAAAYTVANIYGDWAPDDIAAQVTLYNVETATAIAIYENDVLTEIVAGNTALVEGTQYRAANGRGGFGPLFTYTAQPEMALDEIEAVKANLFLENGVLYIEKAGHVFTTTGVMVR